jgi:hypothetical protein
MTKRQMRRKTYPSATMQSHIMLLAIVIYATFSYTYLVFRFDGNWAEGDTALVTRSIEYIQQNRDVDPDEPGPIYENGISYALVSIFLVEGMGISVQTYQTLVAPLLFAIPTSLLLFVFYRKVTNNTLLALMAVFQLYLQPDFLWVTWRGSHEKLLWTLTPLAFFMLIQGAQRSSRIGMTQMCIVLAYITIFASTSTNTFFGSSFIFSVSFAFGLGYFFLRILKKRGWSELDLKLHQIGRLLYVVLASSVLLYLLMFHLYTPALALITNVEHIVNKVALLLLNVESGSNPYQYVTSAWTSPYIYLLLNTYSWLTLLFSGITWLGFGYYFLKDKQALSNQRFALLFIWLMYPAFALQLLASVIVDRTGVLGGNFQVRLFTPVVIVAMPLATMGVNWVLKQIKTKRMRLAAITVLIVAASWFSLAAMIKATNEPVLSNNWVFYSTTERYAGDWLVNHGRAATVWTGIDARLWSAMDFYYWNSSGAGLQFDGGIPATEARYFIFSEIEQMKRTRLAIEWPYLYGENLVYDNQQVQTYFRRPRTPFQY